MVHDSVVDGPGIRHVIFLQGCEHHCPGCQNPQTHALDGGKLVKINALVAGVAKHHWVDGVTFSGGEPFLQPRACVELIERIHKEPSLAHLNFVSYTGFLYEQLLEMGKKNPYILKFLNYLDLLIDGPFILAKRDLNLAFRGSTNQRIINLKEARQQRRAV